MQYSELEITVRFRVHMGEMVDPAIVAEETKRSAGTVNNPDTPWQRRIVVVIPLRNVDVVRDIKFLKKGAYVCLSCRRSRRVSSEPHDDGLQCRSSGTNQEGDF